MAALLLSDGVLLIALLLHLSVHLIQQPGGAVAIPLRLWIAAGVLIVLVVLALISAVKHSRRAPSISALAGFGIAVAVLVGHAAPPWGVLSESYWAAGAHANAVSWLALGLVCVAGVWTGTTSLKMLRAERAKPS
ncbi:MAG: hypothetical protein WB507_10925 [Solirubrobacterales bacterium]